MDEAQAIKGQGDTDESVPAEPVPADPTPSEPLPVKGTPVEPDLARRAPAGSRFDPTVLWLVLAGGLIVGTILAQGTLNYGVNDGSRWNTVFYLVEHGTYEYLPDHEAGDMILHHRAHAGPFPDRPSHLPPFYTIDMIARQAEDGSWHYYSSKPPFLPTVLAGLVLLIEKLSFGTLEFKAQPFFFIRTTLILTHAIPLLVGLWLVRRHLPRFENVPFVHHFSIAAVMVGTYVTPWAVTLSNHIPAACAAIFALHATIRIVYDGQLAWHWFVIAGFFAAFAACCELPAGLLAIALFIVLLYKDWARTLAAGLPAAAVPTFVALLTNYLVVGSILPAYADIHCAGGLYDYPGSYWIQTVGCDALAEPKSTYLLNMMLGHHGFFSLNPILLLCGAGLVSRLVRRNAPRRGVALFTLLLSVAVVAVYTFTTNNYGGGTKGIRWLFWLIPLWLLFVSEGVALLARYRSGRVLCYVLLAVSVVSVGDALRRPWGWSWLEQFYRAVGWITY